MRPRSGYRLAGVAWALLLAPVTTYSVLGVVLGMLWIYVYGDDPWPTALGWLIPAIGVAVFLATAVGCIFFADRYGRQREIEAAVAGPRETRRILLWNVVPLVLITILAFVFWQRSLHRSEAISAAEGREAAFTELLNARHTIADLVINQTEGPRFSASVTTSGGTAGAYGLFWQVNGMTYGEILSQAERPVELGNVAGVLTFEISIDELAERYRDMFLNGGGVVVDEAFELIVTVEPIIDEEDVEAWPAFERHRWEQGDKPLGSSMTADLPMFFHVRGDGTIDHSTP